MSKLFLYDDSAPRERVYIPVPAQRRYGFFRFLFDVSLVFVTGGIWLLWIFVREMRRR